jgi:hypothetical protein
MVGRSATAAAGSVSVGERARDPVTSGDMTASAEQPQKRVPDFFIVGHPKSGTTALYQMLGRHPQIYMPRMKEPRFLASDQRDRFPIFGSDALPATLEEYLSLFASAGHGQRIGEASPDYLLSHTAARAIADLQPAARIIAILREPASFLRSLHLQFVQGHVEAEKDLRKALALEGARRQGKHVPRVSHRPNILFYSEHVSYVEQLRRYHAVFPPEQVLVLIYEDFRRNNEAIVRRVLRFLDIDDTAPIVIREANPSVRVRAPRLYSLMHTVSVGQGPLSRSTRAAIKALAPRQLTRESALAIRDRLLFTSPQLSNENLMLDLRHRFKGEVVALSEYLDRDLMAEWGYADLS